MWLAALTTDAICWRFWGDTLPWAWMLPLVRFIYMYRSSGMCVKVMVRDEPHRDLSHPTLPPSSLAGWGGGILYKKRTEADSTAFQF